MNDTPASGDPALAAAPDPFAHPVCVACGAALPPSGHFCEACGVSQNHDIDRAHHAKPIAEARKWIAITGVLYVLGGLLLFMVLGYGDNPDSRVAIATLALNLVIAAIHGGLWWWAGRAPLAASIVALAIFLMVHLTNAVLDPSTIMNGIFLKVFFVIALSKGIRAGLEVRKLELSHARRA